MWPTDPLVVHPDKSCIIGFNPERESLVWWTTYAALVPRDSTLTAGIPGHYFVLNNPPTFQRVPFIAEFEGGAPDAVILLFKVIEARHYAVGVPVDAVLAFKPPRDSASRTQEVDEAALLTSYKLPHAGIKGVRELENTATHKLKDLVDNMLQFIPLFKHAKVKCLADLEKVEKTSYSKNITRACEAAELRLRKAAKERGDAAKDSNESRAGGKDAERIISELKTKLNTVGKWYEGDMEDRYFSIPTVAPTSVRIADDTVKSVHEAIEASNTLFAKELREGLDKLCSLCKDVDNRELLNFVQSSPVEAVLSKPVAVRPMQRQPEFTAAEDDAEKAEDDDEEAEDNVEDNSKRRGRPPGSKNKKKSKSASGSGSGKDADGGGVRLTAKQSTNLLSKVEVLQKEKTALEGQLERELQKSQKATDKVTKLEADIAHNKELTKAKIAAAKNKAKLKALQMFMGHHLATMRAPSSASGSSSRHNPSPFNDLFGSSKKKKEKKAAEEQKSSDSDSDSDDSDS